MANFSTPKKRGQKCFSKLQQTIIALARKKGGEVLARDVLIEYYGFNTYRPPYGLRPGCTVFKKSSIASYNSATVAVCKAFNRLVKRGVARRTHGGVRLR